MSRAVSVAVAVAVAAVAIATGAAPGTAAATASATPVSATPKLQRMDSFLKAAAACYNITGLVAEVTSPSETLYRAAMGVRDIKSGAPVTNDTLFGIGSTTKAFTSALLAQLASQGKLTWNDPVQTYLPSFALNQSWPSGVATLQDLASHRTGVPRNDMLWITGLPKGTYGEIGANVFRLQYFPPNFSFRSAFEYNNWMVATAGYVAGVVAGNVTWQTLLQERLLGPLGMNQTQVSVESAVATGNYAIPVVYDPTDPTLSRVLQLPADVNKLLEPLAPAGILSSTASDMGKWIRFHLNHGAPSPTAPPLFPFASLEATYLPHNALSSVGQVSVPVFPGSQMMWGYGAGWFIGSLSGEVWVSHGGDSLGHHSIVSLTKDVGVFFSGYGPSEAAIATARNLVAAFATDLYSGREPWLNDTTVCTFPAPWVPQPGDTASAATTEPGAAGKEHVQLDVGQLSGMAAGVARHDSGLLLHTMRQKLNKAARGIKAGGPLLLPASTYSGTYNNPGYGDLVLLATGHAGSATESGAPAPLELHYNELVANVTAASGPSMDTSTLVATAANSPYNLLFGSQALTMTAQLDATGKTAVAITATWMEPNSPPVFFRTA